MEGKIKFKKIILGEEVSMAVEIFNNRILNLKKKHSSFLKENDLDFDKYFIFKFNSYSASYNIRNYKIINRMGEDIKNAYDLSFSKFLK